MTDERIEAAVEKAVGQIRDHYADVLGDPHNLDWIVPSYLTPILRDLLAEAEAPWRIKYEASLAAAMDTWERARGTSGEAEWHELREELREKYGPKDQTEEGT
jgi:hypothetical protein